MIGESFIIDLRTSLGVLRGFHINFCLDFQLCQGTAVHVGREFLGAPKFKFPQEPILLPPLDGHRANPQLSFQTSQ